MALFEADDDAERTTMQVAFSGLQSIGNAGGAVLGGAVLAGAGGGHHAYMVVFVASAIARFAAALLLVRQLRKLPQLLVWLPVTVAARAWTLALRPAGSSMLRPILGGIVRFRRDRVP